MKSLKLNTLASENLSKIEMNQIQGGACGCGCCYEGQQGGSSTSDNGEANANAGKNSTGCEIKIYSLPTVVVVN